MTGDDDSTSKKGSILGSRKFLKIREKITFARLVGVDNRKKVVISQRSRFLGKAGQPEHKYMCKEMEMG